MIKILLFFTYFFLLFSLIPAGWTWLGGSNIHDDPGDYGTIGAHLLHQSDTTMPPPRRYHTTWVYDVNTTLFGGETKDGALNDLFQYDALGMFWYWNGGSNEVLQPATYNDPWYETPGARYGCASWVYNENAYLFGGMKDPTEYYNDFWFLDDRFWWFKGGSQSPDDAGSYGKLNIPLETNMPPSKAFSTFWTSSDGKFYLFGGINKIDVFNDLWVYNGANWTWISGSEGPVDVHGTYGVFEIPDEGNTPGSRVGSVGWTSNNDLYLFGGVNNVMFFNDFWKFDTELNQWAWIGGSSDHDQPNNYGAIGIPSPNNIPGSRSHSICWKTTNENIYLFGGENKDRFLNDFWLYDGEEWTLIRESDISQQTEGVYGTYREPGYSNYPQSRSGSSGWVKNGKLLLLGGSVHAGLMNDLWAYSPSCYFNIPFGYKYTILSGHCDSEQQTCDSRSVITVDCGLWDDAIMMCIEGEWNKTMPFCQMGEVETGIWTWIGGSSDSAIPSNYGTKGIPHPNNMPGNRNSAATWIQPDTGIFYLFGGWTNGGWRNDLWAFDGVAWTWVGGSSALMQPGTYGVYNMDGPDNIPGARCGSITWTSSEGAAYIFGGQFAEIDYYNDVWSFDGELWTWIRGSDEPNSLGNYGTYRVSSIDNTPSARSNAASTQDPISGILYMYGGKNSSDIFGDLWVNYGEDWSWISGSSSPNTYPNYGIFGKTGIYNSPGARYDSVIWYSPVQTGSIYLFGGILVDEQYYNDLWHYDGNYWAWISGTNDANPMGMYGAKGLPEYYNSPPGRSGAIGFNFNGRIYFFGGSNIYGAFNDLWAYDGLYWNWISGADFNNDIGVMVEYYDSFSHYPSARKNPVIWSHPINKKIYLFGGYTTYGIVNDFWQLQIPDDQKCDIPEYNGYSFSLESGSCPEKCFFDTVYSVSCESGYLGQPDQTNIVCRGGYWYKTFLTGCADACPFPSISGFDFSPDSGYCNSEYCYIGATLSTSCNELYTGIALPLNITCLPTRDWDNLIGIHGCTQLPITSCPFPSSEGYNFSVTSGHCSLSECDIGSTLTTYCNDEYRGTASPSTITCLPSGLYSSDVFTGCTEITNCTNPITYGYTFTPSGGFCTESFCSVDTSLTIACDNNFLGTPSFTSSICNSPGIWSQNFDGLTGCSNSCTGQISATGYSFSLNSGTCTSRCTVGTVLDVVCGIGYEGAALPSTIDCLAQGSWSDTSFIGCTEILVTCTFPSKNGYFFNLTDGSSCPSLECPVDTPLDIFCDYKGTPSMSFTTCLDDGTWGSISSLSGCEIGDDCNQKGSYFDRIIKSTYFIAFAPVVGFFLIGLLSFFIWRRCKRPDDGFIQEPSDLFQTNPAITSFMKTTNENAHHLPQNKLPHTQV